MCCAQFCNKLSNSVKLVVTCEVFETASTLPFGVGNGGKWGLVEVVGVVRSGLRGCLKWFGSGSEVARSGSEGFWAGCEVGRKWLGSGSEWFWRGFGRWLGSGSDVARRGVGRVGADWVSWVGSVQLLLKMLQKCLRYMF